MIFELLVCCFARLYHSAMEAAPGSSWIPIYMVHGIHDCTNCELDLDWMMSSRKDSLSYCSCDLVAFLAEMQTSIWKVVRSNSTYAS